MSESDEYQLTSKQKRLFSSQYTQAIKTEKDSKEIDSIESLYSAFHSQDEVALLMLTVRDWMTRFAQFDPISGNILPTGIIDFFERVSLYKNPSSVHVNKVQDRIYRIVLHTKDAIIAIIENTRNKVLREHAMLPIHSAREVDSTSVQWLSRQPGRTLREKLSGKPYIKAVKRRPSFDTPENRLLKAFVIRLEHLLVCRNNAIHSQDSNICDELLVVLQRWLRTDEAIEIGNWKNSPPNNTLLQDKCYRKIWDGWLWLQKINQQVSRDYKHLNQDILNMLYWNTLALLHKSGRLRTIQQPVRFDYDDFTIQPIRPIIGYFFPHLNTEKLRGFVKNVNKDANFGFITTTEGIDLFFHKNNLTKLSNISKIKVRDIVTFELSSNNKGLCADNVSLVAPDIMVSFSFDECWKFNFGKESYLINVFDKKLVIEPAKQKNHKHSSPVNIETISLIPEKIVSIIMETSIELPQACQNQNNIKLNYSAIDLCAIRPLFTNSHNTTEALPFRLLEQRWNDCDNQFVVDCGNTKSIRINENIETVSMRSLFLAKTELSDATKSQASMNFVRKLQTTINTEYLTYLVPDWGNDFDLESIRKSINFYFNKSSPLPRSIASIFAWQSSDGFIQEDINDNCIILVVDAFYGGFSVTPVTYRHNSDLAKKIPETKGATWERHPSFIIENKYIEDSISKQLQTAGCVNTEQIIQLFGLEGISQEAEKLTIDNETSVFHLQSHTKKLLKEIENNNKPSHNFELRRYLTSIKNKTVYIRPLNSHVFVDPILKKFKRIQNNATDSSLSGALTFNSWQSKLKPSDISLWRDHLPELSISIICNGHSEDFYLVKNATVTPQRGKKITIPIAESFILPANKKYYRFQLQQGAGKKELQFVAYLKSPAFPLQQATSCKLDMTYTYGADNPYELRFIPYDIASAGFKFIQVEWRSVDQNIDFDSLPIPDFPMRHTWSDFQNLTSQCGKKTSNLLEWIERDLNKVSDIVQYGRISGKINKSWIIKENENIFCFVNGVFIHKNCMSLQKGADLPSKGNNIDFFKVIDKKGRASGLDVTLSGNQPNKCFLTKSIRFPVLTIWNHGHSLSEPNVPKGFAQIVLTGTQNAIHLINSPSMPDSLKSELFFFLCCLHKDAPQIVSIRLVEFMKDKGTLLEYKRNIAYAIGNAELSWQQELLDKTIEPIDNNPLTLSITLEILAIALWRSKNLIKKLTVNQIEKLNKSLYSCLVHDVDKVVNSEKNIYVISTLCKHLELLLALIRSRENNNTDFKVLFLPAKDMTKKYINLIDTLVKIVITRKIDLKSRISLQIDKPTSYHNTPDLLYALRMYLTCDSGANTIVINSVNDDT